MIPKGTKLYCENCGEIIAKIIKDLSDNVEIRKAWKYIKGEGMKCKKCGMESDLYRLIVEEFDARSI